MPDSEMLLLSVCDTIVAMLTASGAVCVAECHTLTLHTDSPEATLREEATRALEAVACGGGVTMARSTCCSSKR